MCCPYALLQNKESTILSPRWLCAQPLHIVAEWSVPYFGIILFFFWHTYFYPGRGLLGTPPLPQLHCIFTKKDLLQGYWILHGLLLVTKSLKKKHVIFTICSKRKQALWMPLLWQSFQSQGLNKCACIKTYESNFKQTAGLMDASFVAKYSLPRIE